MLDPIRPVVRAVRYRWLIFNAYGSHLIRRPVPERRFVIVSAGRAGSHLLVSLLNSHPDLYCHNDRFILDQPRLSPYGLMDGLSRTRSVRCFGAQLPIYRIAGDPTAVYARMHTEGWQFIHLVRENIFRQSVSALVAKARGSFHRYQGEVARSGTFRLEPAALVEKMAEKSALVERERAALERYPHRRVIYERDLEDASRHQHTADDLFQWLGLQPAVVETNLVKTGRKDLSQQISNYDEIMRVVTRGPYARHLESA